MLRPALQAEEPAAREPGEGTGRWPGSRNGRPTLAKVRLSCANKCWQC